MPTSWKLAAFVVATAILVAVSRRSLRRTRSHGFPRFFAWEGIAALAVLNLDRWFDRPFCPAQVASWMLLSASGYLVLEGLRLMKRRGNPSTKERPIVQESNFAFENTTKLVDDGLYRYIRHPLYSSLLLLTWGVFLKSASGPAAALALATTACLFATAMLEEREDIDSFGPEYAEYMKRTRRFIPFLL
jgi:protein-S-isoprenylcysteine O-methyltransferase Ste14